WDLCAGPHVANTGDINMDAVALESVAGAYWRGDESKAKLQRVYGTAWETPAQLKAYTALKEEAARRDHRKLGQELDLFSIQESAEEIRGVLDLVEEVLSTFGFTKYEVNLSTRPEKSVGDDKFWQLSEDSLKEALQSKGWDYKVDAGGGAFYGPKIDIKIQDAIGRKWQFDIAYVDEHNNKLRPIMIHRAIFGSVERFFGILIENYAGAFPLWLAPMQASRLAT
ncbi:AA_TRNA_LIGASE_II domain-containing protein, partial [Haematococcus lacustris]